MATARCSAIADQDCRVVSGNALRSRERSSAIRNSPFLMKRPCARYTHGAYDSKAADDLSKDRTIIAIAHRLSTVRRADSIVVLEQGRVIEIGSHNDLIAKGGVYARMIESQSLDIVDDTELSDNAEIVESLPHG